ncbi:MAG: hypothetical protein QGI86_23145 [Candidatus Poribacteria bacterium]|jgi:hypothetical protein|nr:hypothetical protein [Candidatus Poribacteria bacterium]
MKLGDTTNFNRELIAWLRAGTLATTTVSNVRRICIVLASTPGCLVKINEERAISFVEKLDIDVIKRTNHYMEVSFEFRDVQSEACFHLTLHLFNFGYGFRHPLHKICGIGAWQTMKRGIEVLHATAEQRFIGANTLLNLSESIIDELFQFSPKRLPLTISSIAPLRKMILGVAYSTGETAS